MSTIIGLADGVERMGRSCPIPLYGTPALHRPDAQTMPGSEHREAESDLSPDKTAPEGTVADARYADLWDRPGYIVRRLHQVHMGLFAEECAGTGLTPVQYGMLSVLSSGRHFDQLSLSSAVGIDRTSGADVIKRLARRGLLERTTSEKDRRAKVLRITIEGRALVETMSTPMAVAQERFVSPLTSDERTQLFRLLRKMLAANDEASRSPLA